MTIKVALAVLLDSVEALKEIGNRKYPTKDALALGRLIRKCNPHIKGFMLFRDNLLKSMHAVNINGAVTLAVDKQEEFGKKIMDEMAREIDLGIHHLPFEILERGENPDGSKTLHPRSVAAIGWAFGEPTEVPPMPNEMVLSDGNKPQEKRDDTSNEDAIAEQVSTVV